MLVGTVDGCGYDGQHKDASYLWRLWTVPMIWSTFKPVFHWFQLIGYGFSKLLIMTKNIYLWVTSCFMRGLVDQLVSVMVHHNLYVWSQLVVYVWVTCKHYVVPDFLSRYDREQLPSILLHKRLGRPASNCDGDVRAKWECQYSSTGLSDRQKLPRFSLHERFSGWPSQQVWDTMCLANAFPCCLHTALPFWPIIGV